MQRWIAVGVVTLILLMSSAGVGLYYYKQSRPYPIWVPLKINPEFSNEKRDEIVKALKTKLTEHELLLKVSQDVDLKRKWRLASDEEGARLIGERLFVELGEADTPMGKVPSINVGVRGTKKEMGVSGEISMRLIEDVWAMLGIKPPSKQGG
jgi:hypothetical protein